MENNNQENLKQGIFNYLKMQNTGALMVTGSWGCGKSYYFEHVLFDDLKKENYKPVRVSLFGMSSLKDLSKNIIYELTQYATGQEWINKALGCGAKVLDAIKNSSNINDYVDLKSIWGEGKALYNWVPDETVVCLDDLERAIEKFDINDLLGVINDLVENQHMKVIVIANKEYIDGRSNNDTQHDIFYEKVIEKTLHFVPCILDVFTSLVNLGDENFFAFMMQEQVLNSVDPVKSKSIKLRRLKENIRSLKFAVSHFKVLFDSYVEHGVDVKEEQMNRILLNQWLFVYAISLESKRNILSIEDCKGLDTYVSTAKAIDIDLGSEEQNENLFEEEQVDGRNNVDIAGNLVDNYYGDMAVEYVFYPDIYQFVLGGVNFDFEKHMIFTQKAFERFDYKGNPAQDELRKWMNGFWTQTDHEAAVSLKRLLDFVGEGKLTDFFSYLNASVFLLNFCSIINFSEEDVLAVYEKGLQKFASTSLPNAYTLSMINMLQAEKSSYNNEVFSLLMQIIEENQHKQMKNEIAKMNSLFISDIQLFMQLFLPTGQTTPKFFNVPILHHIKEQDIRTMLENAQPNDIMNLYSLLQFRYSDSFITDLREEMPFVSCLKKVAEEKVTDETKLSSMIICRQLLPELEKVEKRMLEILSAN